MTISITKQRPAAPPDPAVQTAADVQAMRDVISANGWYQNAYYDWDQVRAESVAEPRARVDMYGALNIALCGWPFPMTVLPEVQQLRYLAAVDAIAATLGTIGIKAWQDVPERTAEDVLDALDRTVTRLRGEAPA